MNNRWPPTGPGELPQPNAIQPPFGGPSGPSAGPTDTVPAWLTPGEAVLNRNAVQLAGRGNIDQLNRMGGAMGYAGGIGYVDPKDVDPIWQEIQLQAPGINVAALRQKAQQSGISSGMIRGLVQAFMKSRTGTPNTYQTNAPTDLGSLQVEGYAHGGFIGGQPYAMQTGEPWYYGGQPHAGQGGNPNGFYGGQPYALQGGNPNGPYGWRAGVRGYAHGTSTPEPPDLPPDNTFEPPNLNAPPFGNVPPTPPNNTYYDDLHDIFNQPGLRYTPDAPQRYAQAVQRSENRFERGLPDVTYGLTNNKAGGYGYDWGTGPLLPPGWGGIGPDAVYGTTTGVPSGGLSWRGRSPGFGGRAPQQL
jgi:hypothetical protein